MSLRTVVPEVYHSIASMEHDYLWIGGFDGPCMVAISGAKKLKRLVRMILRYAHD